MQQSAEQQEQVQALLRLLRETSSSPNQCPAPPQSDEEWSAWEAELTALLPDPNAFQAHSLRQHLPAWEALLGDRKREPSRHMLSWLQEGIQLKWQRIDSPEQQKHPRWRQNLHRMQRAIIAVHGEGAA